MNNEVQVPLSEIARSEFLSKIMAEQFVQGGVLETIEQANRFFTELREESGLPLLTQEEESALIERLEADGMININEKK